MREEKKIAFRISAGYLHVPDRGRGSFHGPFDARAKNQRRNHGEKRCPRLTQELERLSERSQLLGAAKSEEKKPKRAGGKKWGKGEGEGIVRTSFNQFGSRGDCRLSARGAGCGYKSGATNNRLTPTGNVCGSGVCPWTAGWEWVARQ